MSEKRDTLPQGWEWKKLPDVVLIGCERGFNPTIIDGKVPFIGMSDIDEKHGRNTQYILESFEKVSNGKTKFQKNAVLVGKITPCTQNNKVSIVSDDIDGGFATTEVFALHCSDKMLPLFLNYYVRSDAINKLLVDSMMGATGRQRVPTETLKNLPIPLPPLEEQRRIVGRLDGLFAKIDASIALLNANIASATSLMPSALNEVFEELGEKWKKSLIGNLIDVLTDYHANGSYEILKENVELKDNKDYALMVRATDLENNFKTDLKYISENAYNFLSKTKIYGNEIIMPKIGTIGSVYLMPFIDKPSSLAMNIFLIRCNPKKALNKFLFLFLSSPLGKNYILSKSNGAVTKTITKDSVRSIEIPLPPLDIQTQTVAYLDALHVKAKALKKAQQTKKEELLALKASLLESAFKGELS